MGENARREIFLAWFVGVGKNMMQALERTRENRFTPMMLRRVDALTVKDGDPSLAGAQEGRTRSSTENNPLDIPSPEFNPDLNIPIPPSSLQNVIEAPDFSSRSSREAPREEEMIVTAPRPKQQNIRNPLQGAINNYYRAYARRQTYRELVAWQSQIIAQQQSWNRFANTANNFASFSALGGVTGVGGRLMFAGFLEGVATQTVLDHTFKNPVTAENLLIGGAISSVTGPVFSGLSGQAVRAHSTGDVIWKANEKAFDFGVWSVSQ